MSPVSRTAADALMRHADLIAGRLIDALPLGGQHSNRSGLQAEITYLVQIVASAVELRSTGLLDRNLEWQKVRTRALGGDPHCLNRLPAVLMRAAADRLTSEERRHVESILRFVGTYVEHAGNDSSLSWAQAAVPQELPPPVTDFLAAALRGDRIRARQALDTAASATEAAHDILEPAQREMGRRWMVGELSPREEHLVSQVVAEQVLELLRRIPAPDRSAPLVALIRPDTDEHSLGQSLLQLYMHDNGMQTRQLVDVNLQHTVAMLENLQPEAIAISCTTLVHLRPTSDLITALRLSGPLARCHILVGGRMFHDVPELATQIGADAGGYDGLGAAQHCRQLLLGCLPA
jgi:methanogenic corrinoid protein MtbC1